jgi:hypothetical protein
MGVAIRGGMALFVGLSAWAGGVADARAQVVERERDVTITGPRGRSIERKVRTERGPGGISREVRIQRPGGTYERQVQVERRPGVIERNVYVGGPPRVIERNVVVGRRPVVGTSLGISAPFFGLFLGPGSPPPPPPPPVVVVPEPVYVQPAPVVVSPPQRYVPAPPPQPVVVDPVADALGRLRSSHDNSRRDGALTLGRLGDVRSVPALLDRLKNDNEKEVRVASAWALAEIGDPRAGVGLERAALFDKKREVREAAAEAYRRLPREGEAPIATPAPGGDEPVVLPPQEVPPPPEPATADPAFGDRP